MRLLTALGFFLVLGQDRSVATYVNMDDSMSYLLTCKDFDTPPSMLRLKRHLFCEYDRTVRPVFSHQTANNVTMNLLPRILEFDEWNSRMTLHSWMMLVWNDSHLTWKPSDFDGIRFLHVKSDEIWVPDLSVYNSGDMTFDQTGIPSTMCLISSSGSVTCVPSVRHVAKCATDFASWPYDSHRCHINYGSWSHPGEEVNFHLNKKGYQLDGYTNNTVWDFNVLDVYKVLKKFDCCPNETYPVIIYNFSIKRHYGIMHATYFTPAVAMMLLTLTTLWLDSRSTERMAVGSVNLMCHLLCIFDLHWLLPHNGTNPPNILLYYRDSMLLAVFALVLTALLRKMQEMSIAVPNWITTTTSLVLSNRAGRFLILTNDDSKLSTDGIIDAEAEDNSDLPKTETGNKVSSWRLFAAIIEWLSFFAVIFTYVVILFKLVPVT